MVAHPGVDKARTEVTALMLMEAHDIGEQFLPFAKERGINDVAAAYRVPVLSIFTASDPALAAPRGNGTIKVFGANGAPPPAGAVTAAIQQILSG